MTLLPASSSANLRLSTPKRFLINALRACGLLLVATSSHRPYMAFCFRSLSQTPLLGSWKGTIFFPFLTVDPAHILILRSRPSSLKRSITAQYSLKVRPLEEVACAAPHNIAR